MSAPPTLLKPSPMLMRQPTGGPMWIVNRRGEKEEVKFDKITDRLRPLCEGLNEDFVSAPGIAQRVIEGLYPGITTQELDNLAAESAAYCSQMHPDFSILAARIAISNLHKSTSTSFSDTIETLASLVDASGRAVGLISEELQKVVKENKEELNNAVDYTRDYSYDYFGFKTLERSYLLRDPKTRLVIERPQHMLMRVALGIHGLDVASAIETYDLLSKKLFTHATPTLFNAGTNKPQMSSCFLLSMVGDSIEGIFETLKRCALISKTAGGIGVSISNIRSTGSYIAGSNGFSNGLVPMLRVFNDTCRYVDQGGGKRKGAFAMYLEPWHADVFEFLELKKNHGKEEQRARDLFYALWIPDLFMRRVMKNEDWTLMCPNECPGLADCHGEEFEKLYESYEKAGKGRSTVKAQALWFKVIESQMETGTPYMLYKDACNRKSNQQNLGTIKSSNLCTEIIEFTSPDEVAVCNLASIALPMYVKPDWPRDQDSKNFVQDMDKYYDFKKLYEVTKVATRNLNRIIDRNYYPIPEARNSNLRHRPIGLGVQGLADAFLTLRLPFESDEALALNVAIFETIYFAACEASMELAKIDGPYESFKGSPASKGNLQFDLWGQQPESEKSGAEEEEEGEEEIGEDLSSFRPGRVRRWDWSGLKAKVVKHGMRNSLLVAPMPTASTAQILANNESFEPYTQNLYVRRVLSGEFVQINRHLVTDLVNIGVWSDEIKQKLIEHKGSVQSIEEIPVEMKALYKTVWEIKQKRILDMAAARGPYIDQSQSLNVHMTDCTNAKLSSMHFYGWKLGLKTGMYYLRTQAAADAIQFTVEAKKGGEQVTTVKAPQEEQSCEACSG